MASQSKHLDSTLLENYKRRMVHLVADYQLIKAGKHAKYKFVSEFYADNNIKRQNFIKLYNRYAMNNEDPSLLLPQKRGRKFTGVMAVPEIQEQVLRLREQGLGRYDIYDTLYPQYGTLSPKPSTIYNILKANNLNRYIADNPVQKQRYVKDKIGELVHTDCHYLPAGLVAGYSGKLYLVGTIDDHSRLAWCEVIPNITAATVSMNTMKTLSVLKQVFTIEAEAMLTDNGSEFGSGKYAKNQTTHPFKVLLGELDIKQYFTKPGRPQTNGKIERFWKTIETELLEDQVFDSIEDLRLNLFNYLIYYNYIRPHQGIRGYAPYRQMVQNYQEQKEHEKHNQKEQKLSPN